MQCRLPLRKALLRAVVVARGRDIAEDRSEILRFAQDDNGSKNASIKSECTRREQRNKISNRETENPLSRADEI